MNFDQAKAFRLQQCSSTPDDHDFRMQNPEAHRETLRSMAATLTAEGLIDQLQEFDMCQHRLKTDPPEVRKNCRENQPFNL